MCVCVCAPHYCWTQQYTCSVKHMHTAVGDSQCSAIFSREVVTYPHVQYFGRVCVFMHPCVCVCAHVCACMYVCTRAHWYSYCRYVVMAREWCEWLCSSPETRGPSFRPVSSQQVSPALCQSSVRQELHKINCTHPPWS